MRSAGFVLLLAPSMAFASPTLNHVGRLTDHLGNPIEGAHQLQVKLWDGSGVGAALLHDETFSLTLNDGYYSVVLGSNSGNLLTTGDLDQDVWLEVFVDPPSSAIGGRQRIVDVPHATSADVASTANNATATSGLILRTVTVAPPTCTPTAESTEWVGTASGSAGQCTVNINPGTFSAPPQCFANSVGVNGAFPRYAYIANIVSISASSFTVRVSHVDGASGWSVTLNPIGAAEPVQVLCVGPG